MLCLQRKCRPFRKRSGGMRRPSAVNRFIQGGHTMMNLHAAVRGAVAALHPDETVTLYRSAGSVNACGERRPVYEAGENVPAQIQPRGDSALRHGDGVGMNDICRRAYLFAGAAPASQPAGVFRPLARGGDLFRREDGTWWLITAVPEDFSRSGWVQAHASLQALPPDFSASPRQGPECAGGEGAARP